jgi:uncharacterized protein with HEPN domain
VQGVSKAQYDRDENLRLALTHLLQTIGEAARLVGDEGRQRFPGLPWNAVTGMRHRIVHEYFNVDEEIVWRTATERMDELILMLEPILEPKSP